MRTKYVIGSMLLVALMVGLFMSVREGHNNISTELQGEPPASANERVSQPPIIKILAGTVFIEERNQPSNRIEASDGERVDTPATLETSKDSRVSIHFADGSIARIEENSIMILEEAIYDKSAGTRSVKIQLSVGKIWSKIIELTTPESLWEVKTSNAVATVRGTAFGVSTDGKKSEVLAFERIVEVAPREPTTGDILESAKVVVTEHEHVSLTDSDVVAIKAGEKDVDVSPTPLSVLQDSWIDYNVKEDEKINEIVEQLKDNGVPEESLGEKINESLDVDGDGSKKSIEGNDQTQEEKTDETQKSSLEQRDVKELPPPKPILKKAPSRPTLLEILSSVKATSAIEGEHILFEAVLVFDDGSKRNVTKEVRWKVIGPIGSVDSSGLFLAKLDSSVAEFGKGFGTVVATWVDSETDEAFLGKSAVIEVLPKIDLDTEERG